jgi:ATP-dependent DNA ligase
MYEKVTLYTKQGVKFRQWSVWTEGAEVIVEHGQLDSKLTQKRYTAEPRNVGRANATTAEEQATQEAEAKVVKQLKSGYYHTIEEATEHVEFTPMKAQNSDDYKHKLVFPCYIQPKLNGQRLMIDKNGNAWSKQGEPLELPEHWKNVKEIAKTFGGLDGEIYAGLENRGGLSLQQIISAFRKPNKDTQKLKLFVYDLPLNNLTFNLRQAIMFQIEEEYDVSDIVIVAPTVVQNWEEAVSIAKSYVKQGYEGAILRNFDGMYEFGKRSYDLQKLKFRLDAEAVVVSVTQDKNGDGVLLCQAINGKQTGVQFECLMRKDADPNINYRKYSNALLLIGKTITYEYEELSDKGVPTKPVAVSLREMVGNEGRY